MIHPPPYDQPTALEYLRRARRVTALECECGAAYDADDVATISDDKDHGLVFLSVGLRCHACGATSSDYHVAMCPRCDAAATPEKSLPCWCH